MSPTQPDPRLASATEHAGEDNDCPSEWVCGGKCVRRPGSATGFIALDESRGNSACQRNRKQGEHTHALLRA